jgi:hypothetical protein
MAAALRSQSNIELDKLLERTGPRPASIPKPKRVSRRKPFTVSLQEWAGSQVAAYRVGLLLGYAAMIYFGASALVAGIPSFQFTTPEGFTPIWSVGVVLGGFIAAVGSLKAGSEPMTKDVIRFNRIELTGAILLFLTLGTYAVILLILGYRFGDNGRASIGAGFVALGVHPTIRMFWLFFRPRFIQAAHNTHLIKVGSMLTIPAGYTIAKLDEAGNIIPETPEQTKARLAIATAASTVPVAPPSRVDINKGPDVRA